MHTKRRSVVPKMALCRLDKLEISGIRSFSPDRKEYIEFQSPLTMILGSNGCGKTTIIECLKFATTGGVPPSAGSGRNFVHDPKMAGSSEVKAMIKLRFADVSGRRTRVIRSMQVTQKKTALSFKQLDGVVECMDADGNKTSITHRCTELDSTVPALIGVSKAILESVIFCHQEESSWPLSEPKEMKKKFDEIFASARYTKALEELRKKKTSLSSAVKVSEEATKTLREQERSAKTFRNQMEQAQRALEECDEEVDRLEGERTRVVDELDRLESLASSSRDTERKIELCRQDIDRCRSVVRSTTEQLGEENVMVDASSDDLMEYIKELSEKEKNAQAEEDGVLQEKEASEDRIAEARKELSRIDAEKGSLNATRKHKQDDLAKFKELLAGQTKEAALEQLNAAKRTTEAEELSYLRESERRYTELSRAASAAQDALEEFQKKRSADADSLREKQDELTGLKRSSQSSQQQILVPPAEAEEKHRKSRADLEKFVNETMVEESRKLDEAIKAGRVRQVQIEDELGALTKAYDDIQATESDRTDLKLAQKAVEKAKLLFDAKKSATCSADGDDQKSAEDAKRALDQCISEENEAKECDEKARYELRAAEGDLRKAQSAVVAASSEDDEDGESLRTKLEAVYGDLWQLQEDVIERGWQKVDRHGHVKSTEVALDEETQDQYFGSVLDAERERAQVDDLEEFCSKTLKIMTNKVVGIESGISQLSNFFSAQATVSETQLAFLDKEDKCFLCKRHFDQDKKAREDALVVIKRASVAFDKKRWSEFATRANQLIRRSREVEAEARAWATARESAKEAKEEVESKRKTVEECRESAAEARDLLESKIVETAEARLVFEKLDDLAEAERAYEDAKEDLKERQESLARLLHHSKDQERTTDDVLRAKDELYAEKARIGEEQASLERARTDLVNEQSRLEKRERENENELARARQLWEKKLENEKRKEQLTAEVSAMNEARSSSRERERSLAADVKDLSEQREAFERESKKKKDEARSKKDQAARDLDNFKALRSSASTAEREIAEIERDLKRSEDRRAELEESIEDATEAIAKNDELLQFYRGGSAQLDFTRHKLNSNLTLKSTQSELDHKIEELEELRSRIDRDPNYRSGEDLATEKRALEDEKHNIENEIGRLKGKREPHVDRIAENKQLLKQKAYQNVRERSRTKIVELETTTMAVKDVELYYNTLDKAVQMYHGIKIKEINKLVKELWQTTYQGDDVDLIEIVSGEESSSSRAVRSYNYQVQMRKAGGAAMDMKGRCSAGQRVLASIVVRLALAQSFCLEGSGLLCLDEPTTNLDAANRASLATGLARIIAERSKQANFQLVVITHDERFISTMRTELETMAQTSLPETFWRVSRQNSGGKYFSTITECDIDTLNV